MAGMMVVAPIPKPQIVKSVTPAKVTFDIQSFQTKLSAEEKSLAKKVVKKSPNPIVVKKSMPLTNTMMTQMAYFKRSPAKMSAKVKSLIAKIAY